MIRRLPPVVACSVVVTTLVLAGCASGGDQEAGERSVETSNGVVEIPTDPEAALGMYTTDVDTLITLGYPLAKLQPVRSEYETFPGYFPDDAIEGVESFGNFPEFNYEKIASAEPDFILNSLAYEEETVTRLPQIAPTYSYNGFDGTPWREHFRETARVLDRLDEYDEWTVRYDERLAEVKAAIGDKANGLVVAPISYYQDQVLVSCASTAMCSAFDELGIEVYDGALADNGKGVSLSVEEIAQLSDIDVVLTTKAPGSDEDALGVLKQNPLWTNLPAVQQQQVVAFERELLFGSPSGQMALLDEIEKALAN